MAEPVRRCRGYLKERLHQLDYQGALEQELPIGSGRLRVPTAMSLTCLKRPGAWWPVPASRRWEPYWAPHQGGCLMWVTTSVWIEPTRNRTQSA